MIRIAFKMKLKIGVNQEYKKRHDALWPEMKIWLKKSGICDYSIFLDVETRVLFAVQNVDIQIRDQNLNADDKILKKWWHYMADLMEVNDDSSPVMSSLEEMFYLD
ncbi:L-rhamnose mutarotase [Pedobacter sp. UYEF25]